MSEISALKNFGDIILEKNPRTFIFDEIPSDAIIVALDFCSDPQTGRKYNVYITSPESLVEYGYNKDETGGQKHLSFAFRRNVNIIKFKNLLNELKDNIEVPESRKIVEEIINAIEYLKRDVESRLKDELEKISKKDRNKKINKTLNDEINKEIKEKIRSSQRRPQDAYIVLYYDGRPLVEYEGILEAYKELYKKKFYVDYETACMVCGNMGVIIPKEKHTDLRKVFPFYELLTFDKAHSLSYFDENTAHTYYPLCYNCAISALIARRMFIDKYLSDTLGEDVTWVVVPEAISFDERLDEKHLKEVYQEIMNWVSRISSHSWETEKFGKYQGLERVLSGLIEYTSRKSIDLVFHFIFISRGGEGSKPLMYVNNVHEIVLRKLYENFENLKKAFSEAISGLNKKEKYNEILKGISPIKDLYAFFNVSEGAYAEVRESSAYDGLLAIEKLLRRSPLPPKYYRAKAKLNVYLALKSNIWPSNSPRSILKSIVKLIIFTELLKSFGCLRYEDCVIESNMFKILKEGSIMSEGTSYMEAYENVAKKLLEKLDPSAKSAYSLGVLLGLLAVSQSKKLSKNVKDVPIIKRMTSLHLNEVRMKSLFSEIQSKADYYDARSPLFKVFEKIFNESWMKIAHKRPNWLDMEYYFALGLSSVLSGYIFDVFNIGEKEARMNE